LHPWARKGVLRSVKIANKNENRYVVVVVVVVVVLDDDDDMLATVIESNCLFIYLGSVH
jgi:hypothetical protein